MTDFEKKDYYHKLKPFVRVAMDLSYYRTVEGVENIPDEPALYAANHLVRDDSLLISLAFTEHTGKAIRFGAKREYFEGKGVNNKGQLGRVAKWLVENTHQIPVVRQNGTRQDIELMNSCVREAVARGDSIGLHPEGTRSPDGRLYKFKLGAANLAIAESLPIVPVGVTYDDSMPLSKISKVTFGEAVDARAFVDGLSIVGGNRARLEALSNYVESRVAEITGQERAGEFADAYGVNR